MKASEPIQHAIITEVIDRGIARSYILSPDISKGTEKMAPFKAGQYVTVFLSIEGKYISRAYSISSGPHRALGKDSHYELTVEGWSEGWAARYIPENWKVGTEVTLSLPQGTRVHTDQKHVIALAGGTGVTPYRSMAEAIVNGQEDFHLTILYGVADSHNITFKEEFDRLQKQSEGKVKVVYVLTDKEEEGFETGYLSSELIRKQAPDEPYSIFLCGPRAMYIYEQQELKKLDLPEGSIIPEVYGDYNDPSVDSDYPVCQLDKTYRLTVHLNDICTTVDAPARLSLLRAMEAGGLKTRAHCRSGECGFCKSRLISGQIFVPQKARDLKPADQQFIHPCVSYPLSDVELEIEPADYFE